MSHAPRVTLSGRSVGSIGYGLMGFTTWNQTPFEEAVKVMKTALDSGANFWNAGTFYGSPQKNSLHLLKEYFRDAPTFTADGSPEGIRKAVDDALKVLEGCKTIDLFECARVDPKVPIETSVQTLAELIKEGKIGCYGLSEVKADTIRRAHAVHPVAAVEVELSLFSRDILAKGGVYDTCRELGVQLIAYSPLDRGWLTGQLKTYDDLAKDDHRRNFPRFQPGAFEKNVELAQRVEQVAKRKGVTSAQVALAWVRQQGAIPLPGSSSITRVKENCHSITLNSEELAELKKFIDETEVSGHRFPAVLHPLLSG